MDHAESPGYSESRAKPKDHVNGGPPDTSGCYLSGIADPSADRTDAWRRAIDKARSTAADNRPLARSVTRWISAEAVVALAAASAVVVLCGSTLAGWVMVGVTLLWAITLERMFWLHLSALRSEEGKPSRWFGIPNVLTSQRMLLTPIMGYFMANPRAAGPYGEAMLYTLLILGFTDTLDGIAARALDQRTVFGKYVDPLTDIIVTTVAALGAGLSGAVPWWLIGLTIFRYSGALAGFLMVFTRRGTWDFQPTWVGKLCTPAVQLLFFIMTLGIIRPNLAVSETLWFILIGSVGAVVGINVLFLLNTLFKLLKVPQGDTP